MMRFRMVTAGGAAAALIATLVLQVGLAAAPHQGPGSARRAARGPGAGLPPSEREVREAMEHLMITRMRRTLELTPEQEESVIPKVKVLLETKREFAAKRRARMAYLRAVMLDGEADDAAVEDALENVRSVERTFRTREDDLRRTIHGSLSPRQQARLLFFERRFRDAMQRRLREAMRARQGAAREGSRHRPPQRPGEPDAFDDPLGEPDFWEDE